MTPETYRRAQRQTADTAKARVTNLFTVSTLAGGLFTIREFIDLAASSVAAANSIATLRADLFISGLLRVPFLGLGGPTGDLQRIRDSLNLILDSTESPLPRVERLARSEPLSAGQGASRDVMLSAGIDRYYWKTDADPCGLCTHLANSVWPTTRAGITHPGCSCLLMPITQEVRP